MRAGVVVVPRARLVPWFVVADRPWPACGQHSVPDCELADHPSRKVGGEKLEDEKGRVLFVIMSTDEKGRVLFVIFI